MPQCAHQLGVIFGNASVRIHVARREDMAMRNGFWDEIGDTLFVAAIAIAIGLVAANLAIQVNKERAAFDAANQQLGQLVDPRSSPDAGTGAEKILPAS
jgi:hypothetical protein